MGKLNAGKPRNVSPEERARRAEFARGIQARRREKLAAQAAETEERVRRLQERLAKQREAVAKATPKTEPATEAVQPQAVGPEPVKPVARPGYGVLEVSPILAPRPLARLVTIRA